jgi:2-polyprenyl-3-methyl-5-hydroxy-6-metoxy-1,4-benzoquinol methylase
VTFLQKEYDGCPLCLCRSSTHVEEQNVERHPLYQEWMKPTIWWVACDACNHVYNTRYFTAEGFKRLFEKPAISTECPSARTPRDRMVMAKFIERAWPWIVRPYPMEGSENHARWLDVGFGNGALVVTAEEYGYEAVGLDARRSACDELSWQGYNAACCPLDEYRSKDAFHVVTMLDVLEHMVDPIRAVKHVKEHLLMPRGGVLIVSTPNMECDDWKRLGKDNPYWREVEHLHNFSRRSLMVLLRGEGFTIQRYHPSERYIAGMEIIARI